MKIENSEVLSPSVQKPKESETGSSGHSLETQAAGVAGDATKKKLSTMGVSELNTLGAADLRKLSGGQLNKLNTSQLNKLNIGQLKKLSTANQAKLSQAQKTKLGQPVQNTDQVTLSPQGRNRSRAEAAGNNDMS